MLSRAFQPSFSLRSKFSLPSNEKALDESQEQNKKEGTNGSLGSLQPEAEGSPTPVSEPDTFERSVTSRPTLSPQYLNFTTILTAILAHGIIVLLKSSIKLSIKKTPRGATLGVFLCLLKARRLRYLSHLSCHLRISHSVISSELTPTSSGSRTSSIKHFSIKSHLLS